VDADALLFDDARRFAHVVSQRLGRRALAFGYFPYAKHSRLDSDEIRIAGAMLQRPVPLVRCKTIPLDVPADAEIVLECEVRSAERQSETPFGEFPGTFGLRRLGPVLEINRSPGGAIRCIRTPSSLRQSAAVGAAPADVH
jgi:hypothetical protein